MILSMIVGMTEDRVIGKDNDLPWPKIKEDMKHFRKITTGHPIIMGRKTWDSIPDKYKPLPKRTNIVVTRQKDLALGGAEVFNSLEGAITYAATLDEEVFIIGGSSLYKEALPKTNKLYLTIIKGEHEGDTFFPEFDKSKWAEEILSETEKATFYLLERSI
jgi:dihydrofolate reductase